MENNVQVQKTADISSLVCVVIVSLSALTAYNLGEKFNHYILFDATIFIISLVMLILTFAVFRKVMAGLYKSISNSAISKQVQSNCSQEVSSDNSITEYFIFRRNFKDEYYHWIKCLTVWKNTRVFSWKNS